MNLHSLAVGPISAVNPQQTASVQFSTGSAVQADGIRVPSYAPAVLVSAQVQALTGRDLRHADALNLQGTVRAIYFFGSVDAIERFSGQGGDLVTLPNATPGFGAGTVWLVNQVMETWAGWCKCICTLQNGS